MKLTIRFADKIVGAFIILALGILVFAIFMLGSNQRWFSRDYYFKTYFSSAAGLSQNMAVQYKGFTIGHVKSIRLAENDLVEVRFTIFDIYIDRVKQGSLVDVNVSPIGMGNQFLFFSGKGNDLISEGETIPAVNSHEGRQLQAMGLTDLSEQGDGISAILNRAGTLFDTLNILLADVQEALAGTSQSSLGRIVGNVETMTEKISGDVIDDVLNSIATQIEPILANIREISAGIAAPDSSVMAILDSDGEVYADLAASLDAISGILQNLEKTSDFIPAQLPQVAVMLTNLHIALRNANDTIVALNNNPLLRGGIPERKETKTGGAQTRDLEF